MKIRRALKALRKAGFPCISATQWTYNTPLGITVVDGRGITPSKAFVNAAGPGKTLSECQSYEEFCEQQTLGAIKVAVVLVSAGFILSTPIEYHTNTHKTLFVVKPLNGFYIE